MKSHFTGRIGEKTRIKNKNKNDFLNKAETFCKDASSSAFSFLFVRNVSRHRKISAFLEKKPQLK